MNSQLIFRPATDDDWEAVSALLEQQSLPLGGAREHLAHFILGFEGEKLVCAAGIEPYGAEALLRSVAVDGARQGKGYGQAVVREMLAKAKADGIHSVVLLTTTADRFFERFGFQRITRADVPDSVRASEEFRSICPLSAVVMRLDDNDRIQ